MLGTIEDVKVFDSVIVLAWKHIQDKAVYEYDRPCGRDA